MSSTSEDIVYADKTVSLSGSTQTGGTVHISFEELEEILEKNCSSTMEKFSGLKAIGAGGTASIISAYEAALGREVAIKVLRPEHRKNPKYLERFIREARATAQIAHPNIVPIHEIGILENAGVFFTMKKINGETLKDIIEKVRFGNQRYVSEYPQHRLLEIFIAACQGVAFAHSKGIIHRDLKPENIMVGDYGEVLVLDWGLVKHLKQPAPPLPNTSTKEEIQLDLKSKGMQTVDGAISGTPLFMSPEQAEGDTKSIDHKTDIYSLGTILYSILTLCGAPFDDTLESGEILELVVKGDFIRPTRRAPKAKISRELEAICLKAMANSKHDRYHDVKALIADIRNYQYGFPVSACSSPVWIKFWKLLLRHPVISSTAAAILAITISYLGSGLLLMHARFTTIRDTAGSYIKKGTDAYIKALAIHKDLDAFKKERISSEETPQEKELTEKLHDLEMEMENNYSTALMLYSSVPPAYENNSSVENGFREVMKNRIEYSLMAEDYQQTRRWIELLKIWLGKKYKESGNKVVIDEINDIEKTIAGETMLTIKTTPVDSDLELYKSDDDRENGQSATFMSKLAKTPFSQVKITHGSYILKVIPENSPAFVYPVFIPRGSRTKSVEIEIPGKIPDGTAYIPAGEYITGGVSSRGLRQRTIAIPGFFIKKHEVTFGEYLKFWKTLKSPADKLKFSGKIRLDEEDRCFLDAWDDNGNLLYGLKEDRPAIGITTEAARAYCRWLSAKTGMDIRLPSAEEWEKAARGVDGREYVWGNRYHENYAYTIEDEEARKKFGNWAPPGSFPQDISVYGVSDLEGNVREMTTSKFFDNPYFLQIKGASSSTTKRFLFCSYSSDTAVVPTDIGFRYVIPYKK